MIQLFFFRTLYSQPNKTTIHVWSEIFSELGWSFKELWFIFESRKHNLPLVFRAIVALTKFQPSIKTESFFSNIFEFQFATKLFHKIKNGWKLNAENVIKYIRFGWGSTTLFTTQMLVLNMLQKIIGHLTALIPRYWNT